MGTHRPGTDVMTKLGDCSKLKLEEIDLISRTLKCEIEIFHFDEKLSFTSLTNDVNEEEEELPIPTTEDATDDEDRVNQSVKDLNCLIRRIEKLQLYVLKRKEEEQTEFSMSESSEMELEPKPKWKTEIQPLSCEEKQQIRKLLHEHYLLQCQIDDLIFCYQKIRNAIKKTNILITDMERETCRLQIIGEQYKEWADQVIDELSSCNERHQYLKNRMISKSESKLVVNSHAESANKRSQKYLNKRLIAHQLLMFRKEIEELLQFAHELRTEMEKRLTKIDKMAKLSTFKI